MTNPNEKSCENCGEKLLFINTAWICPLCHGKEKLYSEPKSAIPEKKECRTCADYLKPVKKTMGDMGQCGIDSYSSDCVCWKEKKEELDTESFEDKITGQKMTYEERRDKIYNHLKRILAKIDDRAVVELWDMIDWLEEINRIKGRADAIAKERERIERKIDRITFADKADSEAVYRIVRGLNEIQ